MVAQFSSNIEQENDFRKNLKFNSFENISAYIIIDINKIKFLKNYILRREKNIPLFDEIKQQNQKIKNNNSKRKENLIEKKQNNTINKNIIIRYCITSTLIFKFIIINIFCQIKSNLVFDSINFQYSSKITLKIKGIGEKYILGNHVDSDFTGVNYLKEVHINGYPQNDTAYKYYLDQEDNLVELIWDNNINTCRFMFFRCYDIIEIDLSEFNSTQIEFTDRMFAYCISLTSLNLTNFKTSQIINIHGMFAVCQKLISLNLSKFNTSQVIEMGRMFWQCTSLTSLDLSNFDTSQVQKTEQMFCGCTKLEYINLNNFDESKLNIYYNMFDNVPENVVICLKEINSESILLSKLNSSKNCFAIDCRDDFNSKQFKLNNNDNECNEKCDTSLKYPYLHIGKCYENCSYYHYFDNDNDHYCTEDLNCPNEYPKLNENKMECIKNDFSNMINDLIIKEKNETEKMAKIEEIEYYDNLLKNIENGFTNNYYDTSNLDNGQDEILKTEKVTITLTTVENQKNNINTNMTIIDLGECEYLLRDYYNISINEKLYMKKIEVIQEGMKIPKIEYDVYCPLFGTNLIKLNLTVCSNSKISISIPMIITEDLDKLNSSSGYYNDICYTTTSEDGTDIILKDRKKDFINNNKTVCQDDCKFSKYDSEKMKVECTCYVKESASSIANMNINKNKLLENIKDIKNIANLNFLVCYKNLFKIAGIKYNIGSYIILAIIFFYIISIIVFCTKEYNLIKKKIKKIFFGMNNDKKRKVYKR